jgi:hypothetical protein
MASGDGPIFLLNHWVFSATQEDMARHERLQADPRRQRKSEDMHHPHGSIDALNMDFVKVLNSLFLMGVQSFPQPARFLMTFRDHDRKRLVLEKIDFSKMMLRLVILAPENM